MFDMYVVLLCLAVSMDSFAAGIAYGIKNIHLPFLSLFIVGLVTGGSTAAAMYAGELTESRIDTHLAMLSGSLLLVALGLYTLYQEYRHQNTLQQPALLATAQPPSLLLRILAEPTAADVDCSQVISAGEAFWLSLALGIDNMTVVFSAYLTTPLPLYTPLLMGLIQLSLITLGMQISKRFLPQRVKRHLPILPGLILILLGVLRLT